MSEQFKSNYSKYTVEWASDLEDAYNALLARATAAEEGAAGLRGRVEKAEAICDAARRAIKFNDRGFEIATPMAMESLRHLLHDFYKGK